jgi:hypothetical protein
VALGGASYSRTLRNSKLSGLISLCMRPGEGHPQHQDAPTPLLTHAILLLPCGWNLMQTTRLESGRELVISRQKDSERQREAMYPDIPQQ